jgi:hypothetical protein
MAPVYDCTMSTVAAQAADLDRRLRAHYRFHFDDPRRERLFLSSLGFGVGAVTARSITHMIKHRIGPFHNLSMGGRHLHHLVIGITALLVTGYTWLLIADDAPRDRRSHRANAVAYGMGAALTLDEFALWLDLEDVYWARQGRISVDALMLFGAILSASVWGGPFVRAAASEILHK